MYHCQTRNARRGAALIIGFFLVLILFALAFTFASRMTTNMQRLESDVAGERAYELAQTANSIKIQQIWSDFKAQDAATRVAWLGGEDANGNGVLDKGEDIIENKILDPQHLTDYQDSDWVATDSGAVCTRIKMLSMLPGQWVLARATTWARVKDSYKNHEVTRKIKRVVRFSMKAASIFDFAYFATNYGAIDGNKLAIYGPLGANGDIQFTNKPIIDGKIFAGANKDTGMLGDVKGKTSFDNPSAYSLLMSGNPLLRPTNPTAPSEDKNNNGYLDLGEDTNLNGVLDTFNYDLGYDGTQQVSTRQAAAAMPLLEDLATFKNYSASYVRAANPAIAEIGGTPGGVVKQLSSPGLDPTVPTNYTVLINQVYGDSGEAGLKASKTDTGVTYMPMAVKIESNPALGWKNGNVSLIGTAAQPLVIEGPVVVTNDLAIQGVVTGQGTFFVGRNIHVTGDVVYANPPQWSANDTNFDSTVTTNKTKDLIGFGARGNIILGNYTDINTKTDQWDVDKQMMSPPYSKSQNVYNPHDDQIGYGPPQNPNPGKGNKKKSKGTFPGDYTTIDGDKKYLDNDTVPSQPNRNYYESTFSDLYIKSIAVKPSAMNGVYYAGHLVGGRANNLVLFGSLISHDEAILSDGTAKIIYDPRVSPSNPKTFINLFLPSNAALNIVYWKDNELDVPSPLSPDW